MWKKGRWPLLGLLGLTAVVAVAVAVSASSGTDGGGGAGASAPVPPTGDLPTALERNLDEGDEIVGEGQGALEQRLADLEGHPVVVNQWASWCTSCRAEFPFFSEAIERYGDRVAFVGLDSEDERAAAEQFLVEFPVGFPSVFDPDASVAASLGGGSSWPTTFFFDASGEQVHTKIGAYATGELLNEDIERFALAEG